MFITSAGHKMHMFWYMGRRVENWFIKRFSVERSSHNPYTCMVTTCLKHASLDLGKQDKPTWSGLRNDPNFTMSFFLPMFWNLKDYRKNPPHLHGDRPGATPRGDVPWILQTMGMSHSQAAVKFQDGIVSRRYATTHHTSETDQRNTAFNVSSLTYVYIFWHLVIF